MKYINKRQVKMIANGFVNDVYRFGIKDAINSINTDTWRLFKFNGEMLELFEDNISEILYMPEVFRFVNNLRK